MSLQQLARRTLTLHRLGVRSKHTGARVVFSGIQPTGTPHLGNYLGALSNWVSLQNEASPSDALIFSVVGLHAITVPQDPVQLREDRMNALASLLAIGLNPERCIIFQQEDVAEHAELSWILGCHAPLGRLSRMTAYKSKVASMDSAANDEKLGLFAYPVLQAADILLYKATHVPVGEDQRQHLELTRDLAQVFNQRYSPSTFPLPATLSTPTKRILSLRDPHQKMSKSASDPRSRILLSDSKDFIASKIRKAVTDSEGTITYEPERRPGISNLLRILHECQRISSASPPDSRNDASSSSLPAHPQSTVPETQSYDEALSSLASSFQSMQTSQFKEAVINAVDACLAPIRSDLLRLRNDEAFLRRVARDGAAKARERAAETMKQVKSRLGLD